MSGDGAGRSTLAVAPDPDLAAGRVPLLVCGRCADLACGQPTARSTLTDGEVTWGEVRWEDGREEAEVDEGLGDATFRFERSAHEAAVRGAALAVADLPTWQPPPRRSWWRRG